MSDTSRDICWQRLQLPKDHGRLEAIFSPEIRDEGVPHGDTRLPVWKRLPLECKIPMKRGPEHGVQLYREQTKMIEKHSDFLVELSPNQANLGPYSSLCDPSVNHMYNRPEMRRHLQRMGLQNDSGELPCSLSQYNRYRDYIRYVCLREAREAEYTDGNAAKLNKRGDVRCKSAPVGGVKERQEKVRERIRELEKRRQERNQCIMEERERKWALHDNAMMKQKEYSDKIGRLQDFLRKTTYERNIILDKERVSKLLNRRQAHELGRAVRNQMKKMDEVEKKEKKMEMLWQNKIKFQEEQFQLEDQRRSDIAKIREANIAERRRRFREIWDRNTRDLNEAQNAWRKKRNREDRRFAEVLSRKLMDHGDTVWQTNLSVHVKVISRERRKRFKSLWVLEDVLRCISVPDLSGNKLMLLMKLLITHAQAVLSSERVDLAAEQVVDLTVEKISRYIMSMDDPEVDNAAKALVREIIERLQTLPMMTHSQSDLSLDQDVNWITMRTLNEIVNFMYRDSYTGINSFLDYVGMEAERYMAARDLLATEGDEKVTEGLARLFSDVSQGNLSEDELRSLVEYTMANILASMQTEEVIPHPPRTPETAVGLHQDAVDSESSGSSDTDQISVNDVQVNPDIDVIQQQKCGDLLDLGKVMSDDQNWRSEDYSSALQEVDANTVAKTQSDMDVSDTIFVNEAPHYDIEMFPRGFTHEGMIDVLEDFAFAQERGDVKKFTRDDKVSCDSSIKSASLEELRDNTPVSSVSEFDKISGKDRSRLSTRNVDSIVEGVLECVAEDFRIGSVSIEQLTQYGLSLMDQSTENEGANANADRLVLMTLQKIGDDIDKEALASEEVRQLGASVSDRTITGDLSNDTIAQRVLQVCEDVLSNPENAISIATTLSQSYYSITSDRLEKLNDLTKEVISIVLQNILENARSGLLDSVQLSALLTATASHYTNSVDIQAEKIIRKIEYTLKEVESNCISAKTLGDITKCVNRVFLDFHLNDTDDDRRTPTIQRVANILRSNSLDKGQIISLSCAILKSCYTKRLLDEFGEENQMMVVKYLTDVRNEMLEDKIEADAVDMIVTTTTEAVNTCLIENELIAAADASSPTVPEYTTNILSLAIAKLDKRPDMPFTRPVLISLLRCVDGETTENIKSVTRQEKTLFLSFLSGVASATIRFQTTNPRRSSAPSRGPSTLSRGTSSLSSSCPPQMVKIDYLVNIVQALDEAMSSKSAIDTQNILSILRGILQSIIDDLDEKNMKEVDYETIERLAKSKYREIVSNISEQESRSKTSSEISGAPLILDRTESARNIIEAISRSYSLIGDNSMKQLLASESDTNIIAVLMKALKKLKHDVECGKLPIDKVNTLHYAIYQWWIEPLDTGSLSIDSSAKSVRGIVGDMLKNIHSLISNMDNPGNDHSEVDVQEVAVLLADSLKTLKDCEDSEVSATIDNTIQFVAEKIRRDGIMTSRKFADDVVSELCRVWQTTSTDSDDLQSVMDSIKSLNRNADITQDVFEEVHSGDKAISDSVTDIIHEAISNVRGDTCDEKLEQIVDDTLGSIEDIFRHHHETHPPVTTRCTTADEASITRNTAWLKSIVIKVLKNVTNNELSVDQINELAATCATEISQFCFDQGIIRSQVPGSTCTMIPSALYVNSEASQQLLATINTIIKDNETVKVECNVKIAEEAGAVQQETETMGKTASDNIEEPRVIRAILSLNSYSDNEWLKPHTSHLFTPIDKASSLAESHDYSLDLPAMDQSTTPTQRIAEIIRSALGKVISDVDMAKVTDEVINTMAAVLITANDRDVVSDERVSSWIEHGQQFASELKVIETIAKETIDQLIKKVSDGELNEENMERIASVIGTNAKIPPDDSLKRAVCEKLENVANELKCHGLLEVQCKKLIDAIADYPNNAQSAEKEIADVQKLLDTVLHKISDILRGENNNDNCYRSENKLGLSVDVVDRFNSLSRGTSSGFDDTPSISTPCSFLKEPTGMEDNRSSGSVGLNNDSRQSDSSSVNSGQETDSFGERVSLTFSDVKHDSVSILNSIKSLKAQHTTGLPLKKTAVAVIDEKSTLLNTQRDGKLNITQIKNCEKLTAKMCQNETRQKSVFVNMNEIMPREVIDSASSKEVSKNQKCGYSNNVSEQMPNLISKTSERKTIIKNDSSTRVIHMPCCDSDINDKKQSKACSSYRNHVVGNGQTKCDVISLPHLFPSAPGYSKPAHHKITQKRLLMKLRDPEKNRPEENSADVLRLRDPVRFSRINKKGNVNHFDGNVETMISAYPGLLKPDRSFRKDKNATSNRGLHHASDAGTANCIENTSITFPPDLGLNEQCERFSGNDRESLQIASKNGSHTTHEEVSDSEISCANVNGSEKRFCNDGRTKWTSPDIETNLLSDEIVESAASAENIVTRDEEKGSIGLFSEVVSDNNRVSVPIVRDCVVRVEDGCSTPQLPPQNQLARTAEVSYVAESVFYRVAQTSVNHITIEHSRVNLFSVNVVANSTRLITESLRSVCGSHSTKITIRPTRQK